MASASVFDVLVMWRGGRPPRDKRGSPLAFRLNPTLVRISVKRVAICELPGTRGAVPCGLRSPRDLHGQSPMMGGRNRSNRRSFVRVILNSPPRHASFRPRTFPRVSPTTRVALAGDGAGGGCVCVSVRDDLIITVLPPSASVSATTSPHRHTRVTLVSSGTAREGGTRDEEVG